MATAMRIAARFFDRSTDTKTFKRGMDAYNNPDFYRQLGNNPAQLTAAALKRSEERRVGNRGTPHTMSLAPGKLSQDAAKKRRPSILNSPQRTCFDFSRCIVDAHPL